MLSNLYSIAWGDMQLVAGGVLAYHYLHVTPAVTVRTIAAVVNATTIDSADDVVITFNRLRAGVTVAIGTINLTSGTTAGQGASETVDPIELLPGDVVQAITTTVATVAGGTATASIGVSTG